MHRANNVFWKYVSEKFPSYFNDEILEFGSHNVNGSIRIHYNNAKKYTGIDWRAGDCVDVVCFAHEFNSDNKVKAILSASMLEHDIYWKQSLSKMISLMEEDAILVLSWGGALNPRHNPEEAPDNEFHSLKIEYVINFLKENNLYINTALYEAELKNILEKPEDVSVLKTNPFTSSQGWGEYCLVAFNKNNSIGYISELLDEDKI